MPEHFTKNTEAATWWCPQCQRSTMHRVDGGRRGPCLEHQTPVRQKPAKPEQTNLFAEKHRAPGQEG